MYYVRKFKVHCERYAIHRINVEHYDQFGVVELQHYFKKWKKYKTLRTLAISSIEFVHGDFEYVHIVAENMHFYIGEKTLVTKSPSMTVYEITKITK